MKPTFSLHPIMENQPFKALIRVVKSLANPSGYDSFGSETVLKEPLMYAKDKAQIKKELVEMYPQFFPAGKVYEKETKDSAQFFYVLIYPLAAWEIKELNSGEWVCVGCGQVHENKYLSKPRLFSQYGEEHLFCRTTYEEKNPCVDLFKGKVNESGEEPTDNHRYIDKSSPTYIYKITEKSTGKSYIGKTRNEPFFRWWSHLTHSRSPFGVYLRSTQLSDWVFEVLEVLDPSIMDAEVFKRESEYIHQYDTIANGFNMMVSQKLNTPPTL